MSSSPASGTDGGSAADPPGRALVRWLERFTEFVGTKRGLAEALHSGDPAYDALPEYLLQQLEPVLAALLKAAAAELRADLSPRDVLYAIALLCQSVRGQSLAYNRHVVAVFVDGLCTVAPVDAAPGRCCPRSMLTPVPH